jgi:hypothetical protein
MRAIPGIEVYLPADGRRWLRLRSIWQSRIIPLRAYGSRPVPTIYGENAPLIPGKANRLRQARRIGHRLWGNGIPGAAGRDVLDAEGIHVMYTICSL